MLAPMWLTGPQWLGCSLLLCRGSYVERRFRNHLSGDGRQAATKVESHYPKYQFSTSTIFGIVAINIWIHLTSLPASLWLESVLCARYRVGGLFGEFIRHFFWLVALGSDLQLKSSWLNYASATGFFRPLAFDIVTVVFVVWLKLTHSASPPPPDETLPK